MVVACVFFKQLRHNEAVIKIKLTAKTKSELFAGEVDQIAIKYLHVNTFCFHMPQHPDNHRGLLFWRQTIDLAFQ